MSDYAKIIVNGTPISKSNFKLVNKDGRTFMPQNTGSYHDRYAKYEEEILIACKNQCPNLTFNESLIAVLKVFYKSFKRHPDTNNITKSIFDGVEKSGLIINDAQIRRLIIEEYYDATNPRFELELFKESVFNMVFEIRKNEISREPITYYPPPNYKGQRDTNQAISKIQNDRKNRSLEDGRELLKRTPPLDVNEEIRKLREGASNRISLGKSFSSNKLNISDLKGFESKIKKELNNKSTSPNKVIATLNKNITCSICNKKIKGNSYISADKGKTIICNSCLKNNLK